MVKVTIAPLKPVQRLVTIQVTEDIARTLKELIGAHVTGHPVISRRKHMDELYAGLSEAGLESSHALDISGTILFLNKENV